MRHCLRKVAALGFLGWSMVTMGLAGPGCSSRLGPVQATQSAGSVDHPNLPNSSVERSKECMEFDGRQLGPGRTVLGAIVQLNDNGDKVSVTVDGVPETARDFGICIRKVLQDMPIAEQSLHDAVKTLKFNRKHAGDSQDALERFIEVIPGVPIVESELVLEADGYTVVLPITVKVVNEQVKPLDLDEPILKKIGKTALDSLGYDEIKKRATDLGWVKTVRKTQPKAAAGKGLVAQVVETEVVIVMFEVFTTHAVTAGVVSQLDSPLPGPADLAAIGIIALGLYKAGAVGIEALRDATAPTPTSRPSAPPPPPPPPPEQTRREKPDKCPKIQAEIDYLITTERKETTGSRPDGYQGLAKRWREYATNEGKWGYTNEGELGTKPKNHLAEYKVHQKRLQAQLILWKENRCEEKGHTLPNNAAQYAEQVPQLGPGKPLVPAPLPVYKP